MEDDEEIQSYQNGAQPVTVATAPPQHTLTLALPIQLPKTGAGGGREDCWSEGATAVLIEAWGERYLELSRGNLKQKQWKEVADIVSSREDYTKPHKTDVQCKNRIDTLKKKYKLEKSKIGSGQGPSKWNFFHRLDQLIGPNSKISATAGGATTAPMLIPTGKATGHVPVAIPVGSRAFQKSQQQQHHKKQEEVKQKFVRRGSMESNSSESSDSFPPETVIRKRGRAVRRGGRGWGNSMRELSRAILELGEAYERAETSKLQQVVEMEKKRMGFAKELELQRMHFFIKTQLELSQMNQTRRVGHHHQQHPQSNNRNSSD